MGVQISAKSSPPYSSGLSEEVVAAAQGRHLAQREGVELVRAGVGRIVVASITLVLERRQAARTSRHRAAPSRWRSWRIPPPTTIGQALGLEQLAVAPAGGRVGQAVHVRPWRWPVVSVLGLIRIALRDRNTDAEADRNAWSGG